MARSRTLRDALLTATLVALLAAPARAELMDRFTRGELQFSAASTWNDRLYRTPGPLGYDYLETRESHGGAGLGLYVTRHWPSLALGGFADGILGSPAQLHTGLLGGATVLSGNIEWDFFAEAGLRVSPGAVDDLVLHAPVFLRFDGTSPTLVNPFYGIRLECGRRSGAAGRKLLAFSFDLRHDAKTWRVPGDLVREAESRPTAMMLESRAWSVTFGLSMALGIEVG